MIFPGGDNESPGNEEQDALRFISRSRQAAARKQSWPHAAPKLCFSRPVSRARIMPGGQLFRDRDCRYIPLLCSIVQHASSPVIAFAFANTGVAADGDGDPVRFSRSRCYRR